MLEQARTCQSRGTLTVPSWRLAPFWPVICPVGQNFAVFVQETVVLPGCSDMIVPGRSVAKLPPVEQGQILALRLNF